MPKDLPMISYKRKYIIFFLKMCPSETLRAFLTNRVILPDDYRKLAIRRYVDGRTPKQLALEFNVSVWWIGEKLKRIEETLIPQFEAFVLEAMAIYNYSGNENNDGT